MLLMHAALQPEAAMNQPAMQTDGDKNGSKLAFQPAARFAPIMDQVHDALCDG